MEELLLLLKLDDDEDPKSPEDPDELDAPDDPENPHDPDDPPPPAPDDPDPPAPDDDPGPPEPEPPSTPTHVCSSEIPGVYTTDELLLYVTELEPLIVDIVPLLSYVVCVVVDEPLSYT